MARALLSVDSGANLLGSLQVRRNRLDFRNWFRHSLDCFRSKSWGELMERDPIKFTDEEMAEAVTKIMEFCQEEGMTEQMAYVAMMGICLTMEEQLGFGFQQRSDA